MILTPTVNNTLQAEFWNFRSESSRSRRVHGPSWENLTSRVQMTCICKPQWRVHPQFSPHIPVRPRVCKLWTVLTNVGILRLFPGIMTSQKRTESGRLVYTTSGVRARYAGPSLWVLQFSMCTPHLSMCTLQLSMCTPFQVCMCTPDIYTWACARWSWARAHFSWACAHPQLSICMLSSEHVHW